MIDRKPGLKHAITFTSVCSMGLPTVLLTLARNIYVFYAFSFLYGVGAGSMVPICNVRCLEIWSGRDDGGPFMYAVHFWFAFGTLVGPLLASEALEYSIEESTIPGVVRLYVMVGLFTLLTGSGHLVMAINARMRGYKPIAEERYLLSIQLKLF